MSNSLKQDIRALKASVFQYLQSLRASPNSELTILPLLQSISLKITECNHQLVKESADRIDRISYLKKEIQSKDLEYYTKCAKMIELNKKFEEKLKEVEEETQLAIKTSNLINRQNSFKRFAFI